MASLPPPPGVSEFRSRILNRILRWSTLATIVPCIAGITLSILVELWSVALLDTIAWGVLAGLAFGQQLPYGVRAGGLLTLLGIVGVGLLVLLGPFGVGLLWMTGVPAIAGVLFDRRVFWLTEAIMLLAVVAIGGAARLQLLWWAELGVDPLWWVMAAFSLVCVSLIVGLSTTTMMAGLQRSLQLVRAERQQVVRSNLELQGEISARRQAERERSSLQQQLRVAQKMELVGQLAGGLAHDLNNILTVILVEGELAQAEVSEGSPAAESLENLLSATDSASALCAKLLLFARRRVEPRDALPLDLQLIGMETLLQSLAGERVRLRWALESPHVHVSAAPIELQQLITNLVANARDAMPDGGEVWVRTQEVIDDAGPRVQLVVQDGGVGIDPAVLDRVFEPFFTTKPEGHGTGLGLSTVYGLVSSLDGSIQVQSLPGRGTTIEILLPTVAPPHAPEVAPPALPGMKMPEGRTVLLVEDNPSVRRAVAQLLDQFGCRVCCASSAEEALAQLDAQACPDLVLTDVLMPGQTGVDLAERLQHLRPALPIVAMSGWLGDGELATRLDRLGVPLLRKPFSPRALHEEVAAHLAPRAASR